ncbi:MAG: hypothetical protein R3Y13_05030 [bacterium]
MNDNYRYTLKGKCTVVETEEGMYVVKEKPENSNISGLYNYLKSRDFFLFPEILNDSRKDVNVYEHVEDVSMPDAQRAEDLVNIVSNLHSKTLYFKEVSEDKFKELYDNIVSNINFLENYYNTLFDKFFKEKYMSPSHYLFMRNFYKVEGSLVFCRSELDTWYELVKSEKQMRVCVNHGDLSIAHFLKSDRSVLISWEKNRVDTPVLDLVNFYKNDLFKYNFSSIYEKYNDNFPLNKHEKNLFYVLITIPDKVEFNSSEFENTIKVRRMLDKLFKTESLIKPYYSEYKEE